MHVEISKYEIYTMIMFYIMFKMLYIIYKPIDFIYNLTFKINIIKFLMINIFFKCGDI